MGTQQSRAFDEQAHAFVGKQRVGREVLAPTRHRERRYSVGELARDAEPFAARHQHRDIRAAMKNEIRELRAPLEQMLRIVEHEQQLLRGKIVAERLDHGPRGLLLDLERPGYDLRHEMRIRERGELHQPDSVGKRVDQAARHFDGQARLARTAGPAQRHQPIRRHQLLELRDLVSATDETRQLIGQVVLVFRCAIGLAVARRHRQGELVASSRHRGNGVGAEDLAQCRHLHVQRCFLDHHLRPNAVEQFVLGDEMSGAIDERGQQIEGARTQ